jgi:catechol 2,3-dioxygenase-like lactoylglutathione lyase family enzyme
MSVKWTSVNWTSPKWMIASVVLGLSGMAMAQLPDKPPARPRITGISHMAVYTSNAEAADHFYRVTLGAVKQSDPQDAKGVRYAFNATQFVEVLPLPAGVGVDRLDHTAWNVTDAEAMRRYLAAKAWKVPGQVNRASDGSRWFMTKDPEGNHVEFLELPSNAKAPTASDVIGKHIIHVGFLVHNRSVEDTFYRDLLGFKPYWFGGAKDGRIDWVSQQTPDSHDWLEYMMTGSPTDTGIPASMSQRTLGVLDHFSIGVDSVPDAYKVLAAGDRMAGARHDDAPKIGLDGKYQFNLYDPDGIRVEMMNFHASQKPCCSPFTAEDPAE